MKCSTCKYKIPNKEFVYCPMCAARLDSVLSGEEYNVDRLRYALGQDEGGKFLYDNFSSAKHMGSYQWKKVEPVRSKLDDFAHLELINLRYFSLLYCSPKTTFDLYAIGKFLGHCSVGEALKSTKLEALVNTLSGTKLFWRCFENKLVQKMFNEGYSKIKAMDVRLVNIDKEAKKLRWIFMESPQSIVHSDKPVCFTALGCICGQCEVIFNGIWEGVEVDCRSKTGSVCEVDVYLCEKEEKPPFKLLTKPELDTIMDELIGFVVARDKLHRKDLGNYFPISVDQCMNYMLLSFSPGHLLLSKHSGVLCGERITEKAGLSGVDDAFVHVRGLFDYFRAGILYEPEKVGDVYTLRMDESVYASGVNNIGMKLDVFLAGIIEGVLCQASGEKWRVEESKCLANGDEYCEFLCKCVK